ncbi:hypothetical protein DM860_004974 [Cuscuta australis]|uniref:protein-serine/threonine phosphatase n=1 Tax=Cuscuta australis TaxID=267555 RepID=A0A328DM05_9ASTE|nr:hypothetical protein DM860_004974 [Cuscuta australis]
MTWSCIFDFLRDCFRRQSGGDVLSWDAELEPHATGDFSMAAIQANSTLEDQGQVYTTPSATYIGVYDGHGGPEASRFISNHLFRHIQKYSREQGGMSEEVLRRALNAIEEDFMHMVRRSWLRQPKMVSVGSCCLVGAISNGVLYVANIGDSRAVLGWRAAHGVVAQRVSTEHNVGVEEVSRSIGDMYLKKPEMSRDPLLVQYGCPIPLRRAVMSAEPSIVTRKLRPEDLFLIFASDGLWEQISDQEAVEIVLKNPRRGIAKRLARAAVSEAAKKREMKSQDIRRIEKGTRRCYHDDITVVVVYLDHSQSSQNGKATEGRDYNNNSCTATPVDIYRLNSEQAEDSPAISP